MRRDQQTILKIVIAFSVAIAIASLFQLPGTITTGILAIISIQPTKTDTLSIILKRILSMVIGFAFALLVWELFGYTLFMYVFVGVLFAFFSFATKLMVGVVPTLVLLGLLVNHGSFDLTVLVQTSMMLLISAVVSAAVTFLYPSNAHKALEIVAEQTDQLIRESLQLFFDTLTNPNDQTGRQLAYQQLDEQGKALILEAEITNKDFLFAKDNTLYSYLKMRQSQMNRIRRLFRLVQSIDQPTPFADGILGIVKQLIPAIGKGDQASPLRAELTALTNDYRQKPLPNTRAEFELRAILFQMLFELDYFLSVKIQYHQQIQRS
jgi:uncharacterized membrane protein YgaE (UPF0421/DUF939 family)